MYLCINKFKKVIVINVCGLIYSLVYGITFVIIIHFDFQNLTLLQVSCEYLKGGSRTKIIWSRWIIPPLSYPVPTSSWSRSISHIFIDATSIYIRVPLQLIIILQYYPINMFMQIFNLNGHRKVGLILVTKFDYKQTDTRTDETK